MILRPLILLFWASNHRTASSTGRWRASCGFNSECSCTKNALMRNKQWRWEDSFNIQAENQKKNMKIKISYNKIVSWKELFTYVFRIQNLIEENAVKYLFIFFCSPGIGVMLRIWINAWAEHGRYKRKIANYWINVSIPLSSLRGSKWRSSCNWYESTFPGRLYSYLGIEVMTVKWSGGAWFNSPK